MSTDRELLELAAKAAGIWSDTDPSHGMLKLDGLYWNPLTDDGDALRLAVKLGIDVKFYSTHVEAWKYPAGDGVEIDFGDDRYAATRRAIVSAAAAIAGAEES